MTVQIGIVLLTFVIFVVLILSNKVKIDLAAMAIPIILEVTQILDFGEAWSGLVNNSVIMMASMFVVGAAVGKTSLLGKMTGVLIKPGASDLKIMIGIAIPILFLGNFVNGVATPDHRHSHDCGHLRGAAAPHQQIHLPSLRTGPHLAWLPAHRRQCGGLSAV